MIIQDRFPKIEIRKGDREDAWNAGTNGQNNFSGVWFWSDIENRAGKGGQEVYEWRFEILWGFIGALVTFAFLTAFALYIEVPFLIAVALIGAFFAFRTFTELEFMQRRKELMSQEIETQVATHMYGLDADAYRLKNIGDRDHPEQGGMIGYDHLDSMSEEEIFAAMQGNSSAAREWIFKNIELLTRIKEAVV